MAEEEKERPKTPQGHYHKEAFCLMRYECQGEKKMAAVKGGRPGQYDWEVVSQPCGHHEIIWNSRDGVTPFMTGCPSCGATLAHVYFGSDRYAPNHQLHPGQKFWRSATLQDIEKMVQRRMEHMRKSMPAHYPKTDAEVVELKERLIQDGYRDGTAPWLDMKKWNDD